MAKAKKKDDPVVDESPVQEVEVTEVDGDEGEEGEDGEGEDGEDGDEPTNKAPRTVTRYGVEYDGQAYTSPRKALDAAGLTAVKGSRLRARFKKAGDTPGTEVEYEGKKFKYIPVPAAAEAESAEEPETEVEEA